MSDIEQLKRRIEDSGRGGVETAHIRDDYEPVGDMMIKQLTEAGEYITRLSPWNSFDGKWRIFSLDCKPY